MRALTRPVQQPYPPSSPLPIMPPAVDPALQKVEQQWRSHLWRANVLSETVAGKSVSSGFRMLDCELPGGGWPTRCLIELLTPADGIGEIRFLSQALARLSRENRRIVLLSPPHDMNPAGWLAHGIDPERILLVDAGQAADRLWAIEQSLRSGAFGALLAWLPQVKPEMLRRFQLAATGANGLSFLFRPLAAQNEASPAPLRLSLQPVANGALTVRLLKRRGPVLGHMLTITPPEVRPLRPYDPASLPVPQAAKPVPRPAVENQTEARARSTEKLTRQAAAATTTLELIRRNALDRTTLPATAARPLAAQAT